MKIDEIIDFLVACGERLVLEDNKYLQQALELIVATNPLPRRVVENLFRRAQHFLTTEGLRCSIDTNFANPAALDRWVERVDMNGNHGALRAFLARRGGGIGTALPADAPRRAEGAMEEGAEDSARRLSLDGSAERVAEIPEALLLSLRSGLKARRQADQMADRLLSRGFMNFLVPQALSTGGGEETPPRLAKRSGDERGPAGGSQDEFDPTAGGKAHHFMHPVDATQSSFGSFEEIGLPKLLEDGK